MRLQTQPELLGCSCSVRFQPILRSQLPIKLGWADNKIGIQQDQINLLAELLHNPLKQHRLACAFRSFNQDKVSPRKDSLLKLLSLLLAVCNCLKNYRILMERIRFKLVIRHVSGLFSHEFIAEIGGWCRLIAPAGNHGLLQPRPTLGAIPSVTDPIVPSYLGPSTHKNRLPASQPVLT